MIKVERGDILNIFSGSEWSVYSWGIILRDLFEVNGFFLGLNRGL